MGGRGGSMGGSHGMGGGGGAGGAAKAAAPAASQTREQQLLAQIKGNPAALMQMSDQDAADTVDAIAKQSIRTDGTQNDTFIQRYLNAIGFSEPKPELLSDTAYEKARKKAGEASMYHADKNFGGKTGDTFSTQLQSGNMMFSCNGYYGAGTYWAWDSAGASGGYGPYQVKAFLNGKAKIVTIAQLDQLSNKFTASHPRTYAKLVKARAGYGGGDETLYSFIAASHGYNVIQRSPQKHTGAYMVTLDRSVLTMSKKINKNASRYTMNW